MPKSSLSDGADMDSDSPLTVQGAIIQHAMAGLGYKRTGICQNVKKCSNFSDACRNSVLFRLLPLSDA